MSITNKNCNSNNNNNNLSMLDISSETNSLDLSKAFAGINATPIVGTTQQKK